MTTKKKTKKRTTPQKLDHHAAAAAIGAEASRRLIADTLPKFLTPVNLNVAQSLGAALAAEIAAAARVVFGVKDEGKTNG